MFFAKHIFSKIYACQGHTFAKSRENKVAVTNMINIIMIEKKLLNKYFRIKILSDWLSTDNGEWTEHPTLFLFKSSLCW